MSLFAFLIVLLAALCHSAWNLAIKKVNGGPELVWLFSVISVALYLPVAIAVIMVQQPEFGTRQILFVAGSAVLHLAYFLLLQRGYRHGDLSLVYPTARATGPLLSGLSAVVVFGEQLTGSIVAGSLCVIVGIFFMSGGNKAISPGANFPSGVSVGFGLSAGVLIGTYTAWDAFTVTALAVPPLLVDYASSVLRSVALAPHAFVFRQRVRDHWRDHKFAVLAVAILNPLAYILVLIALTFTPILYVAPVRELSVLFTVLAGSVLLREGDTKRRALWAVVILVGIAFLAL